MKVRVRFVSVLLGTIAAVSLAAPAALAAPPTTTTVEVSGAALVPCGTFNLTLEFSSVRRTTVYTDAAGTPVMQIRHVHAWGELVAPTGERLPWRAVFNAHFDLTDGTSSISGLRQVAGVPGETERMVGRIGLDAAGAPIFGTPWATSFEEFFERECALFA